MRFEREINIYGDEAVLKRFQANETSISVVQGKISALISESELVELENSQATMYSKLASVILDIESLTLNFSDLTTKYNTVSGQYASLDSKVAQYKASVDGLKADITSVQQDIINNYSTTSQMNAAISAKANEITAELSAVRTTLQNDYSTTQSMNSVIDVKLNQLSLSVSNTYATQKSLTSATDRIETLESWKNEASLKITDSAIISTVTSSSAWAGKADVSKIGTLIQQNSSSVKIAWNNISQYIQFENGSLAIYNGAVSTSQKRSVFDQNGIHFWRDNYYVGKIGTNYWASNNAHRGLVFDIEYQAKFMSWSYAESASSDMYTMILTFSKENSVYDYLGVWLGTNLYTNEYNIYLGANKNKRIFNYNNGIGIQSNDNIFFEIGSGSSNNRLEISSSGTGITGNSLLMIYGGSGITAYNDTRLNFYADLNMHGYSVLNNSDERLKENISDPDISLIEAICGIQVCQYDWRDDGRHVTAGLIAQQVMGIVPDAVKQGKDGLYAIDYISLIPYLIGAIQYLYDSQGKKKSKKAKYIPAEYSEDEIQEALLRAASPAQMKKDKIQDCPKKIKFKMK